MFQRSGFSSSASPQPNQKENNQFTDGQGTAVGNENTPQETSQVGSDRKSSEHQADGSGSPSESQTSESQSVKRRRQGAKRTAFSDSDAEAEGDLSVDDLVKLVQEKEASLKEKQEEVEKMKDKVLRSYAEMENVIERTKRESENSKKFAIQNFAKSLLDVADNLGRASSVVKDSFSKIDQYKDSAGVIPLLKTLLEGVEMTEKQLAEPRAPCSRMTGFRYFSSSSTISSNKIDGVEELNKEMESIFGMPPSTYSNTYTSHDSISESPVALEPQSIMSNSGGTEPVLTHVDQRGGAQMVDISAKGDSKRVAIASCKVFLGEKAFNLVAINQIAKGDVLNVAKIAGISGAKQTSNLIPLCHNIGLTHVRVDLVLNDKDHSVEIEGEAATTGKTGVEMEAMTAVTVAGLTVYDMCKAVSKDIKITDIHLEYKSGGKTMQCFFDVVDTKASDYGRVLFDDHKISAFKKFGVEKFDPVNEQFDPNRHLAVFQVPDPSKPPGTVAAVLKAGYMLHDRIIRPAEVGVTHGLTEDADQTSGA
ncbi:hypothetical protein ACLOJK_035792 [Asimina triloba]